MQVLDLVKVGWNKEATPQESQLGIALTTLAHPRAERLTAELQRQALSWRRSRREQGVGGHGDSALCFTGSWEASRWRSLSE